MKSWFPCLLVFLSTYTAFASVPHTVSKSIRRAIVNGEWLEACKLLRKYKLDANVKIDGLGTTPMHKAASVGNISLLYKLITEHKADINREDDIGLTPLDEAMLAGKSEAVYFLQQYGAIGKEWEETRDDLPRFAPKLQLRKSTLEGIWLEAAHRAIYHADTEEVEHLLAEERITIDDVGENGDTLLHVAVQARQIFMSVSNHVSGLRPQWRGRDKEGLEEVRSLLAKQITFLIAKGAKVNPKNKKGSTPLHRAVTAGDKEVIQLLLSKGAEINVEDKHGWSPLYEAQSSDSPTMFKFLLKQGAVVKSDYVQPIIRWALEGGYILTMEDERPYWDIFMYMLKHHRDGFVGMNDRGEETFLHLAVMLNHKEAVKVLVEKKIYDVDVKDSEGRTPLDRVRSNAEMRALLLELGAGG